jgi:hypothetical protein
MTHLRFQLSRLAIGFVVSCTLALAASLGAGETAQAAPGFVPGLGNQASPVMDARIYRRGRTPIYPYYYSPGRPGGYSFFFGFVPYAKGDIENQAIQRGQYPQDIEWPPVGAAPPRPGWGPKADD